VPILAGVWRSLIGKPLPLPCIVIPFLLSSSRRLLPAAAGVILDDMQHENPFSSSEGIELKSPGCFMPWSASERQTFPSDPERLSMRHGHCLVMCMRGTSLRA